MDVRMIVHDMRSPLNAILLSVQAATVLSENPRQREALQLAERNARKLSEMVESLLRSAPSSAGESSLELRECEPARLVAEAIDQVAPMAAEKGQTLTAREIVDLPAIRADGRLVRVLVNLLSNAVKFTPEGGHVEVEARRRMNDGHPVVIFSVLDDGVGISEEDMARIFVKGVSISHQGLSSNGLGLAVCRELVEAHGGRIWVETGRRSGSAFSFAIPLE